MSFLTPILDILQPNLIDMSRYLWVFFLATTLASAQKTALSASAQATEEKLYRTPDVDSKPEIQEGMYTLPLFVSQHFKLPDGVHNKQVKIFVGFVVETDGTISNVRFIHQKITPLKEGVPEPDKATQEKEAKLLEEMKAESVRVMSSFKKVWNPAIKNGKPVRCQYNYPLTFNLE